MSHTTPTSPASISSDFTTFGPEAISVHRANERRANERDHHQIMDALRATRPTPWVRRWLGTMMIALGTGIAGTTARMQEREATSPLPASRSTLASVHQA